MSFDDKTIDALATSLNFRQMRQEIISSNQKNIKSTIVLLKIFT